MDYKRMYAVMCGAVSDGIDLIGENRVIEAVDLMQRALLEAEELAIGERACEQQLAASAECELSE